LYAHTLRERERAKERKRERERERAKERERANMHCQVVACTFSFYTGLTSAESLKLVCFNLTKNNIFTV
jgi:hypothetical protein